LHYHKQNNLTGLAFFIRFDTTMSINITLADGSVQQFDQSVTGMQIADGISSGLRRSAVAVNVNGELWDLNRDIEGDATIEIITRDTEQGLDVLRHDAAHLMAEAVKELYPDTQVTIGPSIEDGFIMTLRVKRHLLLKT
jgi:threonyl-tRNA synthetase